ncbi:MAG: hypothetical protein K5697_12790, partial [Lachnospiraceae bacterium]|nr:hypothetical protein [Lachnospiraceae bacterium]
RQAMTDAKTEKNKTHAMVDAQKEAEEITDEAERAVVGMVMHDAKDKLDEKLREEQERAEEKKEDEEKQEKTDVIGTDPTAMPEKTSNVNMQLDDLKNKMALIDADLKGIKVDESV